METRIPLIYEKDGAIARIRFNRPEVLNALDLDTAKHFHDACQAVAADMDVRVVVIKGEGRAFVAGGDLAQMREDTTNVITQLFGYMHKAISLLQGMRAPVIGSLHGSVIGGGLSLALACDLAIAAEGTQFNLGYAKVAGSCDLSSSWNLVRHVGLRKALEISLLSDTFDVEEALRLGIVNRVVPASELHAETEKLARRLANGPTVALGQIKKLMRTSLDHDLASHLDAEEESFFACTRTRDFREALDAFAQKRSPRFEGN